MTTKIFVNRRKNLDRVKRSLPQDGLYKKTTTERTFLIRIYHNQR